MTTLDPVLAQLFSAVPPMPDMRVTDVTQVRAMAPASAPESDDTTVVEALATPELSGWLYTPAPGPARAAVLLLHGGGWAIGDPAQVDPLARTLSKQLSAIVVSAGYRLAPEHPAPAAALDALAALHAVRRADGPLDGCAGLPLAVVGASAGANLAAVATVMTQDDPAVRPDAQLLFYPAVDLRPELVEADSWKVDADPLLPTHNAWWSIQTYLAGHDPCDPWVSPLLGSHEQLPPTVIVTAGSDPLADQGSAYAAHLDAGGVHVVHRHEPDLCHGFTGFSPLVPRAAEAVNGAISALVTAWGRTD